MKKIIIISVLAVIAIAFAVWAHKKKKDCGCGCNGHGDCADKGKNQTQTTTQTTTENKPVNQRTFGGSETSSTVNTASAKLFTAPDGGGDCCSCQWKDGKCPCSLGPCGPGMYKKPATATSQVKASV